MHTPNAIFTWPRPKAGSWVLNPPVFFLFSSMSQVCTLETLIGRKSAILRNWLVRRGCILVTCIGTCEVRKGEVGLLSVWINVACGYSRFNSHWAPLAKVGPLHLTLSRINSEINCIAKNKCHESQKLHWRDACACSLLRLEIYDISSNSRSEGQWKTRWVKPMPYCEE